MMQDMTRVFEAQRLVSLETIFDSGGPSGKRSRGAEAGYRGTARLAARITEVPTARATP